MNVGIERYVVEQFHGEQSTTWGVMAYNGDIPLGIDAHWEKPVYAEIALDNYLHNRVAHGRTTQHEHMIAFTHALAGGD